MRIYISNGHNNKLLNSGNRFLKPNLVVVNFCWCNIIYGKICKNVLYYAHSTQSTSQTCVLCSLLMHSLTDILNKVFLKAAKCIFVKHFLSANQALNLSHLFLQHRTFVSNWCSVENSKGCIYRFFYHTFHKDEYDFHSVMSLI